MEAQPECARPRAQQRPNSQGVEQIPRAPSLLPDAAPEDVRTPSLTHYKNLKLPTRAIFRTMPQSVF
jgi:hypothetical protein